ncbi:germinal-center associated nuclear protein-like [Ptychodera flava]|uniref:germinal-center associated nuclear protein-like n=1 Tax=Ptychodera flava TaxID=63121 RepID=UPI00396A86FA
MSLSQFGQKKKKQAVRRLSVGSARKTKQWGRGGGYKRDPRQAQAAQYREFPKGDPPPYHEIYGEDDSSENRGEPAGFGSRVSKVESESVTALSPRKALFGTSRQGQSQPQRELPQDSYEEGIQADDLSSLETFGETSPKKTKRKVSLFAQAMAGVAKSEEGKKGVSVTDSKITRRADTERKEVAVKSEVPREAEYMKEEELRTKMSLRLKGVPSEVNNKHSLRKFFSKFGNLKTTHSYPGTGAAVVTFSDHESAAKAKKHGKYLTRGGEPIQIFWYQSPSKRKSSTLGKSEVDNNNVASQEVRSAERELAKPTRMARSKETAMPTKSTRMAMTSENRTSVSDSKLVVASASLAVMPNTSSTTGVKTDLSTLAHLIGKVAKTAGEKYEVLEERDKLLRQHRKKTSNIKDRKATMGSCPDMCPEKERYMRQYRRHLSNFEIIPGTDSKAAGFSDPQVDHHNAVKEYSRSSADQELPLPHELRSAAVLTLTMNYLLHRIMDRGEGRWADWYDFVWNRTRGIRKDVTQQNLTDVTAVDLIEKCARFHIYCSHRLCEEEMGVFDPKINNENLTKCLQSLEHFYYDLNTEHIHCPNEAEFRAYDILLNLNEGDILRKVQLYREEVRESRDVRQAVEAFNAVNSNNFVRFFKIVRETKYLNACIMHRYFTQVRSRAVNIMNRAYRSPVPSYPLSDFIRILAFEDNLEATDFCSKHGLTVTEGIIHFDRTAFINPEDSIIAARSLSIIEQKKMSSVAEIVNGGPLSPFVPHTPTCSFDNMDRYVGDSNVVLPELLPTDGRQIKQEIPVPLPQSTVPTPPATVVYPNEVVKDITKDLFFEVINEFTGQISNYFVKGAQFVLAVSSDAMTTVANEVADSMTREIVECVVMEEIRREEEERRAAQLAAERESSKQRAIQEICDEIVETTIREECKDAAEMQMREVEEMLLRESMERCSVTVTDEILASMVDTECQYISREVIKEGIEMRDEKLRETEKLVHLMIVARFFKKWNNKYIGRLRLKRDMFTFPSAPRPISAQEQVEVLSPWQQTIERPMSSSYMSLNKRARLSVESPIRIESSRIELSYQMIQHHYKNLLKQKKAWLPLDLPQFLARELPHDPKRSRQYFWKIALSLPEHEDCQDRDVLEDWVEAKLTRGKPKDDGENKKIKLLSLYSSEVDCIEKTRVSVCTKSIQGAISSNDKNHVLGTSGLILALPPLPQSPYEEELYWSSSHERVKSLLESKPPKPAIPLVILLMDWPSTSNVQYRCVKGLQLDRYKENNMISVYSIVMIGGDVLDPCTGEEFSDCISWLGKFFPAQPELTSSPLQEFIESGILQYFTTPLLQETFENKDYYQRKQDPDKYIAMYNKVLEYLTSVITSDDLKSVSWPVPEFTKLHVEPELPRTGWNSIEELNQLKYQLQSCLLPSLSSLPETSHWADVLKYVFAYVEQLPKPGCQGKIALLSRIKWLLNRAKEEYEYSDLLAEPGACPISLWKYVPWNLIIEACVGHVISSITKISSDDRLENKTVWVYYHQQKLRKFCPPVLPLVTAADLANLNKMSPVPDEVVPNGTLANETTEDKPERTTTLLSRSESPQLEETMLSMKDLEQQMSEEKAQMSSYNEQLQKWLHGETFEPLTPITPIAQIQQDTQAEARRSPVYGGSIAERLRELEQRLGQSKRDERIMEMNLSSLSNY